MYLGREATSRFGINNLHGRNKSVLNMIEMKEPLRAGTSTPILLWSTKQELGVTHYSRSFLGPGGIPNCEDPEQMMWPRVRC